MKYFVLVYNRRSNMLADVVEVFCSAHRTDALRCRFRLEAANADEPDIEIVVLGAESEADLRTTHARYFTTALDLLARTRHAVPA